MGPRIVILNQITQDVLTNILASQFGPFVHLTNHVVEAMVAMTLDPQVNPKLVSYQHNLNPEAITQLAQHDSNFDRTPIGQIL
jgi:hypothetical protein